MYLIKDSHRACSSDPSRCVRGSRFTGELVSHIKNLHGSTVSCLIKLKISRSHMIRICAPSNNRLTGNLGFTTLRALCAAIPANHQKCSTLRHPELVNKSQPFLVRGHHFSTQISNTTTTLSMSLSSSFSARRHFNRAFSCFKVLSRATSSGRISPYWLRHR